MKKKTLQKALLTAGIALLLASCGKEAPESSAASTDNLPDTLKVKRLSKTYVITGIGVRGSNKVAIINNVVVKPGDEIDPGVTLEEVQSTYAIILVGNKEHLLRPQDIQRQLDKEGS